MSGSFFVSDFGRKSEFVDWVQKQDLPPTFKTQVVELYEQFRTEKVRAVTER